jgi:hypothetical protein
MEVPYDSKDFQTTVGYLKTTEFPDNLVNVAVLGNATIPPFGLIPFTPSKEMIIFGRPPCFNIESGIFQAPRDGNFNFKMANFQNQEMIIGLKENGDEMHLPKRGIGSMIGITLILKENDAITFKSKSNESINLSCNQEYNSGCWFVIQYIT